MQLSTLHLMVSMGSCNCSNTLPGQACDVPHTLPDMQPSALMVIATFAEAQDSVEAVSDETIQMETERIDARSQVVLHFDFMPESTAQAATAATLLASLLGVAILIAEMVIKWKQSKARRNSGARCPTAILQLAVCVCCCYFAIFSCSSGGLHRHG
ncbi:hypothetical protein ABBQ38_013465 [Trebouxia sp. C0009 RCD-2024]